MEMKTLSIGVALASLALASCGSSSEQAVPEPSATPDASMQMSGPFADAESRMSDAMAAAVGTNVSDTWVRKMIQHHRGAVDMSKVVLEQNPSADAAKMARDTIAKQTAEIADLQKLIAEGTPDAATSEPYRAAEKQMHDAMMSASGADISETYLRKMFEHHKGAVAISDVALANGAAGAIRAKIEKVRADQQSESKMVEAVLNGEPMADAKASSAASSAKQASTPAVKPTAAPARTAPKPASSKAAAPAASPTPMASDMPMNHDMSKMH
ncbi:DUF305 domain-containing protein [Parablastomonas sp. CN1-191]|uniref:DUF305 domain-containing protein n=1 Tax=Parablastomonas sp. CN1-191 TaxID=3400908 RepID=UPI003BF79E6C